MKDDQKSESVVADVLLLLPLAQLYSYRIPDALRGRVSRGTQVLCPVRKSKVHGIVLTVREPAADDPVLSDIIDVTDRMAWPSDLMELIAWVSTYYVSPIGTVARTAMPGLFVTKKLIHTRFVRFVRCPDRPSRSDRIMQVLDVMEKAGSMEIGEARRIVPNGSDVIRSLLASGYLRVEEALEHDSCVPAADHVDSTRPDLTRDQALALDTIRAAAARAAAGTTADGGYQTFLLHGVTGSGKTEVYMRALEDVLALGKGAIVLVPEIALTFQLRQRFETRFGDTAAILHSQMSDSLRAAAWDDLLAGRRKLVVGARSAIFAPVRDLGLVVVDEEHETSYKQQEGLRYNARDLAMVRGKLASCPVILGSATPSLESFRNTHEKKSVYLGLPSRVRSRPMPEVAFVDMKYEPALGEEKLFSRSLADALNQTIAKGESAILFLNRRGYGRFILCRTCGRSMECPNCSITLTHHAKPEKLTCHYCDHAVPVPTVCSVCGSSDISIVGFGTERVEEEVKRLFPGARPCRLDSDTARNNKTEGILAAFKAGEFNVMVGTQIVAKGHDFPSVTLVGVLLAEQSLAFPDFRSAERTFQLLTQVAGRAGRGDVAGRVLIQTYCPENYALRFSATHDYLGFAVEENRVRRERGYPPYSFLAAVEVSSTDAVDARNTAEAIAKYMEKITDSAEGGAVRIMGPAAAAIERIRGRTRLQILIKGSSRSVINRILWAVRNRFRTGSGDTRILIDVDPVCML